jgi:mannose-1-phosphate guanylyltransferase
MKITQAVIAAGGFGTRLKPFTDTAPKPMVPVLGKPLLEWHIEQFKKHGVTEFIITLHHLRGVVKEYFGDGSKWGVQISYFDEESPMGSAGGIKQCEHLLQESFYYIYGDIFSLMDYSLMYETYLTKESPIGMQRVEKTNDYADADVAELDQFGKFLAIHQKPHPRTYSNVYRLRGVFILEKEVCKYIPNGFSDLAKDVLPNVIQKGRNFYGYECNEYTKGIDNQEKLNEVEKYVLEKSALNH